MKRRNVLSSPRLSELKRHRRRAVFSKVFVSLAGIVSVFALLAYVSQLESLNISGVEVSGNKILDADAIKTSVQSELSGKYLWLFPKTNALYFPKSGIKNALSEKFKRIKELNLSVKNNNKNLEVLLTEREPKYTWCGEDISESREGNEQKCYFMDSEGYIFDNAPYFSGNVYFKFYGDINKENPMGEPFLPGKFEGILKFKEAVEGMGLNPVAFWLEEKGDANFALSKELTLGSKIIFRTEADFEKIAENLQAAIATEPLKSKIKSSFSSLLYIDLRFGNKVYNKFR
ncbi:MAG TPA: hypothetical protein VJH06_01440 [Candidatus Paceibacterota bacterium]